MSEFVGLCLNVCCQAREPEVNAICNFEDFWKVGRDCVQVLAVPVVRRLTFCYSYNRRKHLNDVIHIMST